VRLPSENGRRRPSVETAYLNQIWSKAPFSAVLVRSRHSRPLGHEMGTAPDAQRRHLDPCAAAATGDELRDVEWRDVDQAGSRFRIRHGKTRAARRWVAVPAELMAEILRETPPDE